MTTPPPRRIKRIAKTRGLLNINFAELWQYRDLLRVFVARDIKVRYRQTILGPIWLIIQPLAMTGILTTMFSGLVGVSTDDHPAPLFYLSTLILWGYFSQVVTLVSDVFLSNEHLFSKVYFPRLIKPVSAALSNSMGLAIQLILLGLALVLYAIKGQYDGLGLQIFLAPLALAQLFALSLGVGLWLASSTARYRDLANATPFVLQAWFFLTPVAYPFSSIPEGYRAVISVFNPLAPICELWRLCIFGTSAVTGVEVLLATLSSLLILVGGIAAYQRAALGVADTI